MMPSTAGLPPRPGPGPSVLTLRGVYLRAQLPQLLPQALRLLHQPVGCGGDVGQGGLACRQAGRQAGKQQCSAVHWSCWVASRGTCLPALSQLGTT